jgi:general secretion pathway protein D
VVVHEVPVKELLFALARDTKLNIDIHPAIEGRVTLNAVNETLPAILERLSRQVPLRYTMEENTLSIVPDTPYLKTYRINYVNVARSTASSIGVAAQLATPGGADTMSGAAGTGTSGNSSNTLVTSQSNNNFWEMLERNVRAIIAADKFVRQSAEQKAATQEAEKAARQERIARAEAVASAGQAAPQLLAAAWRADVEPLEEEKEVFANPVAGVLTVLGTERQHRLVQQYLDAVMEAAQRQVLIEATIVEVTLKDQYKAGIDWKSLKNLGNSGLHINTLGANLAGSLNPFVTMTYTDFGDFSVTLSLLESFGDTRVLSSPKLMALNNQTALLKVVDNLVYFEIKADTVTTANVAAETTFTTIVHTVAVGLIMSVTPQVNDDGRVTLTVRPTITRKVGEVEDPNPVLQDPGLGRDISNKVPIIQAREMESVLQVGSGQTIVLGGLMQDDASRARDGVPVLSRPEGIGALFGQHETLSSQTELVIFLRPTVIAKPSLNSEELQFFRRYLPSSGITGQARP